MFKSGKRKGEEEDCLFQKNKLIHVTKLFIIIANGSDNVSGKRW